MLASFHKRHDSEQQELPEEGKKMLRQIMETNLSVQQKLKYMCDKFGYKHPEI